MPRLARCVGVLFLWIVLPGAVAQVPASSSNGLNSVPWADQPPLLLADNLDAGAPVAPESFFFPTSPSDDFSFEFARPVTNLQFQHPFIWNEFRPLFMHHEFPDDSLLGGGNARVYAFQVWLRLTDRLQFVASKDGYVDFNPGGLSDEEGWADLATGLKYNLISDPARKFALSVGGTYEWTQGSSEVFQGDGDGIYDFFLSAAQACGNTHLIVTTGFNIPNESSSDTKSFHYHVHLDHRISSCFIPLIELNGYHSMSDSDRDADLGIPLGFEGFDLTNFGSSNVDGNDVVTMAVGFRSELTRCLSFGTAYEWSVTDREDLFEERITCDLSYRF